MSRIRYGRWLIVLFLAVVCLSPTAALASIKGIEVPCRVEPNQISVSVTNGIVEYGAVALDTTQDTTAGGVNNTQTATNDGTGDIDLAVSSSDATGGTGWSLGATRDVNQFTHEASIDSFTTSVAMEVAGTSYPLATGVVTSQTFDLRIGMPTSSDYIEKTITVTILASGG